MNLLIIGKRADASGISEGPVTAFESLAEGLREGTDEVAVFPDRRRARLRMYLSLLTQVVRRRDVINVHLAANFGVLVGLLRPRSPRTVLTVHGYSPLESVDHPYNAFMHRLQIRYLFRNRIYVSSLIRERVESREGLSGGIVIPNAVRPLFTGDPGADAVKDIDVFSLCGYSRTKGSDVLLDALGMVGGRLSVVIAGHGSLSGSRVETTHHALVHAGPLAASEVATMLARTRMYVQPSLYESFGIPVIEALFAGVPAVVSTGAGVAEFLRDGHDALLVPPGDAQALAAAVRKILADPGFAAEIARNGRVTAERFTPRAVAALYRKVFAALRSRPGEGG